MHPTKPGKTHQFFKNHVFRDDESYERFPINSVFGPDWFGNTNALKAYVSDIENYKEPMAAAQDDERVYRDRGALL